MQVDNIPTVIATEIAQAELEENIISISEKYKIPMFVLILIVKSTLLKLYEANTISLTNISLNQNVKNVNDNKGEKKKAWINMAIEKKENVKNAVDLVNQYINERLEG